MGRVKLENGRTEELRLRLTKQEEQKLLVLAKALSDGNKSALIRSLLEPLFQNLAA